jgi:hypothetical protein|tara:strand:+ start:4269 stop:4877 length:609 start_codon:yes stop_codon:yes gene_type:complete
MSEKGLKDVKFYGEGHAIAVFDGYIPEKLCKDAINLFEQKKKFKEVFSREMSENANLLQKSDEQLYLQHDNLTFWEKDIKTMIVNFDLAFRFYIKKIALAEQYPEGFHYTNFKIQKTQPGGGYHMWHLEHQNRGDANRVLVFTIYLNDIKDGGETEFLHQNIRVQPKTGRIVIFPAGYPYIHRGNPPLKEEKYILTSWVMCS